MSQSSAITALLHEPVSPEGTQEEKEYLPSSSYLSTAPMVSTEETQDVKAYDAGPT